MFVIRDAKWFVAGSTKLERKNLLWTMDTNKAMKFETFDIATQFVDKCHELIEHPDKYSFEIVDEDELNLDENAPFIRLANNLRYKDNLLKDMDVFDLAAMGIMDDSVTSLQAAIASYWVWEKS